MWLWVTGVFHGGCMRACCIVCFEICESARDSIGGLYI
jgi:hypothetical protein